MCVTTEIEKLAQKWQDEAAGTWGESPRHATLQECCDELRALAARCDQPAGEPVPLPEPMFWTWQGQYNLARVFTDNRVSADFASCSHPFVTSLYTADQLRTHAGAVAFLRGMSVAEQYDRDLRKMLERAETAERERDEARRDAERYRWLRKFSANSAPMPATIPVLLWAGRYHGSWLHKLDAAIDSAMGSDNAD